MSDASVGWVCGFVLLHLFAARWTYSDVPYDEWGRAAFGFGIDATFGFRRNMVDRLVHFASGLCFARALVEVGMVQGQMTRPWAIIGMILAVLAIGAIYEIFEWLLAVGMSPEAADIYNGQQGDAFDAPKDMAMALLGALAAVALRRRLFAGINAPPRLDRSRSAPPVS